MQRTVEALHRRPPMPRSTFLHVVAYTGTRLTSALCSTADKLLDAAFYGVRWMLLSPEPLFRLRGRPVPRLSGSSPPLRQGPPTLTFRLIGGSSQPVTVPLARPGSETAMEIVVSQNGLPSFCGRPEAAEDSRCNGWPI